MFAESLIDLCALAFYKPKDYSSQLYPDLEIPESQVSDSIDSIFNCAICIKGPVNLVLLPCFHICACSNCLLKLKGNNRKLKNSQ